jgi:hypothetical protein
MNGALVSLALLAGLFCLMSGVAFFLTGLMPGRSASWYVQYGWAAFALTMAFYLLRFASGQLL